jgi:hypothetical protein
LWLLWKLDVWYHQHESFQRGGEKGSRKKEKISSVISFSFLFPSAHFFLCVKKSAAMENFVWNLRLLRAIILLLPGLWLLAARSAKGLSEEGQALLQFKNNITDGSHQLTNWVATDLLPCNWTGITCTGSSVTNINLSNFNISGEVPEGVLGKELIKPRSPSDGSFFFTSFQCSSPSVQISSSRNNKLAVDPFFCLCNFCQEVCYYLLLSSSASLKIEYLPSLLSFGVCSCLVIDCTHQELSSQVFDLCIPCSCPTL